ncbi:hypothetical protein T07_2231 [Trichinella nelsoni]|uniref:Uncharacterized protein n=1 Tax=Trichinella nelsoni TaxID=6336 RepID=A0A0V0RMW1_9BILA|nr:hypothetical protein T07_2231 [Trichinella nelsoni]
MSLVLGLQSLVMIVVFSICNLFHEFLKGKRMAAAHYTKNNGPFTVFGRVAPGVVVGGIFHVNFIKEELPFVSNNCNLS